MISPSVLKRHKLDSDSLKPLFDAEALSKARGQMKEGKGKKPDSDIAKRIKLVDMLSSRSKDGRERQLRDYRIWAAVDMAYDAPFYQETPTIMRHILNTCTSTNSSTFEEEVVKAASGWGLSPDDICCKVKDKNGKDAIALNAPVFNNVIMPYVRSILGTRLAKLFNDRNTIPLLEYEPQKQTEINRVRCEIITDIVQAISAHFGYSAVIRQMIFNTLMYSVAIVFPMEPWKEYKQEGEDGKETVEKQGIRYVVPHITNIFYDLTYPITTANTNTGCCYAGYWTILPYGAVDGDTVYWNTKSVTYGYDWLDKKHPWTNYLKSAFPCAQRHVPASASAGDADRETRAAVYTSTDTDKPVFVTHIFCKLIPADWGLGNYKNEVWFRFTMASDDTVIWADAFPYNPLIVSLYDADQNRARNASFALDAMAGQDEMTNLVNQWLLTMKRNLANIVFYDTAQIPDESTIESLRARTHWQHTSINFQPYNSMKDRFSQSGKGECFKSVTFPQGNTSEMLQGLNSVIAFWDRMLGISAQELGAAASHQQGNKEIDLIASSSSNRVSFTGSFIDEARTAMKQQQYEAAICYLPKEVIGQVSTNIPDLQKHLATLGFKVEGEIGKQNKVSVKGDKKNLMLEGFSSTADIQTKDSDMASAQAEFNALAALNNNPRVAQIIEPKSMVDAYENAAKRAGAPKDFNLKVNPDALAVQSVQQAMPQIAEAVEKGMEEKLVKPLTEALTKQAENNQAQDQQINQLAGLVGKLTERVTAIVQAAAVAPQLQPPPNLIAPPNESGIDPVTGLPIQAAPGMAPAV